MIWLIYSTGVLLKCKHALVPWEYHELKTSLTGLICPTQLSRWCRRESLRRNDIRNFQTTTTLNDFYNTFRITMSYNISFCFKFIITITEMCVLMSLQFYSCCHQNLLDITYSCAWTKFVMSLKLIDGALYAQGWSEHKRTHYTLWFIFQMSGKTSKC